MGQGGKGERVTGRGWQKGMSSEVRLTPCTPAIIAVVLLAASSGKVIQV